MLLFFMQIRQKLTKSLNRTENKNNKSSTAVYVPNLSKLSEDSLKKIGDVQTEKIDVSDAGWLIIPPSKNKEKRSVTLSFE